MSAPPASISGARVLLRRLREIMQAGGATQDRLDKLVQMIAATMVADVCSIYLRRGRVNELFATEGLKREAVHATRLREGEGLVGLVSETGRPLNLADAQHHPRFSYRPETGEEIFNTFLGVPIVRSENVFGVLVVQNRVARLYGDEEVEALQLIAQVLAEMVAANAFGDLSELKEVEFKPSKPERLSGRVFSEGIAIGKAVLHEPHTPLGRIVADDPEAEERRLNEALSQVRARLTAMLEGDEFSITGVSRDVLETFRMLAHDPSWEARLKSGVRAGLSADAAVERVRGEHRARLASVKDSLLREQLHDLEDLDNRLLRALAGDERGAVLPQDAILIARNLGPAELLEYGVHRLSGLALEEGSPYGHAAIIARAAGVPMVGRLAGLLARTEAGDAVILDGEQGEVRLRPEPEVVRAYEQRLALRSARAAEYARLRDQPAVTKDGVRVTLLLNAGLSLDAHHLADAGAEGIGLFRTEFQFMVSDKLPRLEHQIALYRDVLAAAGDRPVTFRTLDLGGDKMASSVAIDREENPALGWRAVRIGLDRPALLRYQLRALVEATEGARLRVMFPLVATIAEFEAARTFVEKEIAAAKARKRQGPSQVEIGAMVETPSLALAVPGLKGKADFISIGANDLMQYFFAADRGNPRVAERYDILAPAALRFLKQIRDDAEAAGLEVSICGDAAGKPLEALAFVALGYDRLSMPASGVGPVKLALARLDAAAAGDWLRERLLDSAPSLRAPLQAFLKAQGAAP